MTLLHVSDVHINPGSTGVDAENVLHTLREDLQDLARDHELRTDVICVTGDLVWTGRPAQFDAGHAFLEDLRTAVAPEVQCENVLLVPGNHDVDRQRIRRLGRTIAASDDLREIEALIQAADHETSGGQPTRDARDWADVHERLDGYGQFLEAHGYAHLLVDRARHTWALHRTIRGRTIGFVGFNTAWSSGHPDEKHVWTAGSWQHKHLWPQVRTADVAIALLHHPPGWAHPHEKPMFAQALTRTFHLVLHGHEHVVHPQIADDRRAVLSAGACYDRADRENGYALVRLRDDGTVELWLRRYDASGGGWIPRKIRGKTNNDGLLTFEPSWLEPVRWGASRASVAVPAVRTDADDAPPLSDEARAALAADAALYVKRLRTLHEHLDLLGFDARVQVPVKLEQAYIRLRARMHRMVDALRDGEDGASAKRRGVLPDADDAHDAGAMSDLPIDEAFARARDPRSRDRCALVVLGDPGSGKTTLLKHFLQAAERPETLHLPPDTVPVFVRLRGLDDPAAGLHDAMTEAIAEVDAPLTHAPAELALYLRRHRPLLLLIDGLDEVVDPRQRAATTAWIQREINGADASWSFVVTSRFAGYADQARFDARVLELHIRPLRAAEARGFIARWHDAVERQDRLVHIDDAEAIAAAASQAAREAERLVAALFDGDDRAAKHLRALARNPLLLQILCIVHRYGGGLPKRRVDLYGRCVDALLGLWERRGLPQLLAVDHTREVLQVVAHAMHEARIKEASFDEFLAPVLEPALAAVGYAGTAEAFLDHVHRASGLLVPIGDGAFAFLHLSFQEYLCARYLRDKGLRDDGAIFEMLAARFGDSWWREVIRLALGLPEPRCGGE
ncbi:MAG: NACHT domain-containing protein, partial [Acidobacteriota bacterium]